MAGLRPTTNPRPFFPMFGTRERVEDIQANYSMVNDHQPVTRGGAQALFACGDCAYKIAYSNRRVRRHLDIFNPSRL
jgi:hypothetical protein